MPKQFLDLDNFEEDFARDSPYVLTSPTSLHACHLLNIKPLELVYRNLEEYEESFSDLPLSQVYWLYEENETARQEKLLKCREMRNVLKQQKMRSISARSRQTTSAKEDKNKGAKLNVRGRSLSSQSKSTPQKSPREDPERKKVVHLKPTYKDNLKPLGAGYRIYNSDTESTDGNLDLGEPKSYSSQLNSCRSAPDLSRGSSTFRKVISSPRQCLLSQFEPEDQNIIHEYCKKYGAICDMYDLSVEDRRIMERLILKKGKEIEAERRAQLLRDSLEQEGMRRIREREQLEQRWKECLQEKRRLENLSNVKRFQQMEKQWRLSRQNLKQCLDEKDERVQRLLEDLEYQRRSGMLRQRQKEAMRQLEVSKALEKLLEEDKQYRQMVKEKLHRRMREAELRKNRKIQDHRRHLAEMNRLEEAKRIMKLERLEQKSREAIAELQNEIEERENRARINYLRQIRLRNKALEEGSGNKQKAIERVQAIHAELLHGLEDWHHRVLELNLAAQQRAQQKYYEWLNHRRARVASDRILRQERSREILRKVHELENRKLEMAKDLINSKNTRSARVKAEKERNVQISRIRAQHGAELRQQLKEKLNPDTFDKKAARVELEMKVLKKSAGFNVKFNPKLVFGKKQRCTCRGQSNNDGIINSDCNNIHSNNGTKVVRKVSNGKCNNDGKCDLNNRVRNTLWLKEGDEKSKKKEGKVLFRT